MPSKDIAYPVLSREIARRGIAKTDIAQSLNISNRALNNRLAGKVSFTVQEAIKIHDTFFPDVFFDYLFTRLR